MSDLEFVKQETKSNVLATAPMRPTHMPCSWLVEPKMKCGKETTDGDTYCIGHQILAVNKGIVKEVKVETKASEQQEIPMLNFGVAPVQPVVHSQPSSNVNEDILIIMKNFSIAIVNLTEMLKKH